MQTPAMFWKDCLCLTLPSAQIVPELHTMRAQRTP